MEKELLVIYHANCWDGFCAAWIAHLCRPHAEFVAAHYGDQPPDVRGRRVLILDFSYPREQLLAMRAEAECLEVLDHHKTAEENLAGLDFCVFDMNKSGSRLAWEWFFNDEPSPWLVDYTEDRDLWRWQLWCSREVNAALRSYPLSFPVWNELRGRPVEEMIAEGRVIRRVEQQMVDAAVRNAYTTHICGYDVPCVNSPVLQSEIGNALAIGQPFALVWFWDKDIAVCSLRSAEDGLDVSEIARKLGGGGHVHAAGFKSGSIPLPELPAALQASTELLQYVKGAHHQSRFNGMNVDIDNQIAVNEAALEGK